MLKFSLEFFAPPTSIETSLPEMGKVRWRCRKSQFDNLTFYSTFEILENNPDFNNFSHILFAYKFQIVKTI